nr:MAG TPA: tail-collar fiber protein [Caudoviricetes sp.]
MSFGGLILTNDGRNEIAKAELGQMYSITDVIFGDGIYNGSYNAITALVNPVMTIPITKVERKESEVWLEIEFCSKDVPKAFYLREVGIKANGMLCYYDNAGTDAEYIDPNAANLVKQKRMRFILSISQECQVNVSVSSTLYALEDDLLAHTNDKSTHITPEERTTWSAKQNHITGAASTIADSNLAVTKALISDSSGKVSTSDVAATELEYLSGATSNIQRQLDDTKSYAKNYADSTYQQATGYTDKKIADLIGGAPETLDTLEEVATAIKENEDVVKALDAAIGKKANQSELDTHTGNDTIHITSAERKQWNGYKEQIAGLNSNFAGLQFKVLTAQMPSSKTAFYLGAFTNSPEKGYIVSAMCSTDKITWISADKISDITFTVNAANNGRGQVRGDIGNEAYYGKWCKVIVAST